MMLNSSPYDIEKAAKQICFVAKLNTITALYFDTYPTIRGLHHHPSNEQLWKEHRINDLDISRYYSTAL